MANTQHTIFTSEKTLRGTEAVVKEDILAGSVVELDDDNEFILSQADGSDAQLIVMDYDKVTFRPLDESFKAGEWAAARQLHSGEPANVLVAAGTIIDRRSLPLTVGTNGQLRLVNGAATTAEVVVAYSDEIITVSAEGAQLVGVKGK